MVVARTIEEGVRLIGLELLSNIRKGVKSDIRKDSKSFEGVGNPSITSSQAVAGSLNKNKYTLRLSPANPRLHEVFEVNVIGYNNGKGGLASGSGIEAWSEKKLGKRKKYLMIRGKDASGYPVPLGNPRRNFFGRAFKELVKDVRGSRYDLN